VVGTAKSERTEKQVHPVVKILVLAHLFVVISWTLPRVPTDIQEGKVKFEGTNIVRRAGDWILVANDRFRAHPAPSGYLQYTGFWQYWDMFAPNPANTDLWLDAVVVYEDGTEKRMRYPRMYELNLGEKYVMERFRKFTERVNGDTFDYKWAQFAQRMAYLAWTEKDNPPVRVELRRHFKEYPVAFQANESDYTQVTFYRHVVNRSELEDWKGW
jgi:hypothetical protein